LRAQRSGRGPGEYQHPRGAPWARPGVDQIGDAVPGDVGYLPCPGSRQGCRLVDRSGCPGHGAADRLSRCAGDGSAGDSGQGVVQAGQPDCVLGPSLPGRGNQYYAGGGAVGEVDEVGLVVAGDVGQLPAVRREVGESDPGHRYRDRRQTGELAVAGAEIGPHLHGGVRRHSHADLVGDAISVDVAG
jgi:hypothetical protein